MRLPELEDDDKKAKKLCSEGLLEGTEDIDKLFYYQALLYVPKVVCSELISRYHDDLLYRKQSDASPLVEGSIHECYDGSSNLSQLER